MHSTSPGSPVAVDVMLHASDWPWLRPARDVGAAAELEVGVARVGEVDVDGVGVAVAVLVRDGARRLDEAEVVDGARVDHDLVVGRVRGPELEGEGSFATLLMAEPATKTTNTTMAMPSRALMPPMIRKALRQPLPPLDAPGLTGWNCAGCWYIGWGGWAGGGWYVGGW